MKKILFILSLLIVNSIWSQAPKLTPAKTSILNSSTKKSLIMSPTLNFKKITPDSGSKTSLKMVRGNGVNRTNEKNVVKNVDENGRYCTTSTIDASKGYDERLVLGNQNDKIYPGAIYFDNAFITGAYNAPTDLNLQPYNITTSLFSSSSTGSSSVTVNPTIGDVRNGIAQLMRRNTQVINGALGGFEVTQVSSQDQLAFELGVGFQGQGISLDADFQYLNQKKKNVYMAKLTQVYFDINTDIQNPNNLIAATNSNTNLVYINKVSYGRIAIIQVASDYSKEEIKAALDFSYSGGGNSVQLNGGVDYSKIRESSEIKGLFYGGDASNTVPVNSFNQLSSFNDYVRNGLRWNPNVTPTPVSYQLKYINDNSVATTQATTSFQQRNCQSGSGVKINLHGIAVDNTDNTCGCAWGTIRVELWETDANGIKVKEINPKGSEGNVYWNAPANNNTPVLKYSELNTSGANMNKDRFNAIDSKRTYIIDPNIYKDGKVLVKFVMKATTDHKDNDFASQGIHGMQNEVVKEMMLQDLIPTEEQIKSNHIYTYKLGPFPSNTNRNKFFHAMFSVKVN
jgi:hypothetical protein